MPKRHHPPTQQAPDPVPHNPVAKHAFKFNKAQIISDKRHYRRKAKHSGAEPFIIRSLDIIVKGSAHWSYLIERPLVLNAN